MLAIDLGGTKISWSVISEEGILLAPKKKLLQGPGNPNAATLLRNLVAEEIEAASQENYRLNAIGISVPGIVWHDKATVWAPNIDSWEDFPLQKEIEEVSRGIPVIIENDRTCHILGSKWLGNARDCRDAVFLVVGTGIGAGILVNGEVVRGANDIAGAVGWMNVQALGNKYSPASEYSIETFASGHGIAALAKTLIRNTPDYKGRLGEKMNEITAHDVFEYYDIDEMAHATLNECTVIWGQTVANLVNIFNPEKVILGGGVFGPAARFLTDIKQQASKWAQPFSDRFYSLEISSLGRNTGVYGAAFAALQFLTRNESNSHV